MHHSRPGSVVPPLYAWGNCPSARAGLCIVKSPKCSCVFTLSVETKHWAVIRAAVRGSQQQAITLNSSLFVHVCDYGSLC